MLVYRIALPLYIYDMSGEGARLYGGRWNPKGLPCLYTADASSLALLEYAVHHTRNTLPLNLKIIEIWLDDDLSQTTIDWHHEVVVDMPLQETRNKGKKWLTESEFAIFKVPSVLVPFSFNLLINPALVGPEQIKISKLADVKVDSRIKI